MPAEWLGHGAEVPDIDGASFHARGDPPLLRLHLWPHRSLPKRGFAGFIAATFALLMLPLLAVLGTPVLWGLAPFVLGTLALTFALLQKSYRDGEVLEELSLWTDRAELVRTSRTKAGQRWSANPHWVHVVLHPQGGPVPNYLTLRGAGREVELGAFLSEDERVRLHHRLSGLWPQLVATARSHAASRS